MIRVLSTRILSPRQKSILEGLDIQLDDYNAINISFRKFSLDFEYDHYIFTSQNAVRGFLRAFDNLPLPEKRKEALSKMCFCVGMKTAKLLLENGLKVAKTAKNSKELAHFISKNHKKESFLFICGNRRREELPAILTENKVRFKELIAYKTVNNPQLIKKVYDAILFFSPSGVQSFTVNNDLSGRIAFCIGDSTGREAALHTRKVQISIEQSIEDVLASVAHHYSSNQEFENEK